MTMLLPMTMRFPLEKVTSSFTANLLMMAGWQGQ